MAKPGTFKPGQSGNPGGNPKGRLAELREAFAKDGNLGKLAAETIRLAMGAAKDADRLKAQELIYGYLCGKPTQPISGEGGEGLGVAFLVPVKAPDSVTWEAEAQAMIAARAAAKTDGKE